MSWISSNLWLIPVLPLLASAVLAVTKQPHRRFAAALAIGSMALACLLSWDAFLTTLHAPAHGGIWRDFHNFRWFQMGDQWLWLGWLLDPLTAVMLVMVSTVGLLIFIYSVGYMEQDANFTRFFCFLALFGSAMLGLVMANSLLLLFICWELVGLTSYLLIGFWYHKPSAAAAATKAFITTRIGDVCFFLGILWLYGQSGTLLFYDHGRGCLEATALTSMVTQTTISGMAISTAIGLLIFCGAVGKSGQVPLHVWLPDAMEGPTPVSALIHAATMVAAGVFLVARVFPLLNASSGGGAEVSGALTVVAWVGSITAVFAACIAVAQTDIKRILAYSTVSQLGYMMLALGVGGYAAGVFHLITHAFFKALLFLGAGSVIHGCHEEQDIRRMGGLRKYMPATFATYAIGMMALAGVPVFFSGFWSKDDILHSAFAWPVSKGPFFLGLIGAFLTAFYMTRQVCYVFYGDYRSAHGNKRQNKMPHESPAVMTTPLKILAAGAILLGLLGTPAWPWFQDFLTGQHATFRFGQLFEGEVLGLMLLSTLMVAGGIGLGWWLYGLKPATKAEAADPLERVQPAVFGLLREKFRVDEIYAATVIKGTFRLGEICSWFERTVCEGCIRVVTYVALGFSWLNRFADEYVVNLGFDTSCRNLRQSAGLLSSLQDGQVQNYLRVIGVAMAILVLLLVWGGGL
ncbi:MAG: NADH-quinone oxidoreductase subunit L [Candidatus Omnitrophica bacterium]|nr:NADH-quinone oxidoreductase subunit L [Candidatus Omnitrophota bacterium]